MTRGWLLLLASCGRVGFGDVSATDAGGTDSSTSGDGSASARCLSWSAFGTPVVDEGLSTTNSDDWVPRITADGLSVLQDRYNGSDFDVAISTRASTSASFPAAVPLAGADATGVTEQCGQLSIDRQRLYSYRLIGADYELWQYSLAGTDYVADLLHPLQDNSQHLWISDDELRAYWIDTRGGDGVVAMSSRASISATFGAGTVVLTTTFGKPGMSLALSPDELDLMISAPEVSSADDLDIHLASRPDRQAMFAGLVRVPELSTGQDDVVGSWSADLTTAYVNLDTDVDGGGDAEVWVATRVCLD